MRLRASLLLALVPAVACAKTPATNMWGIEWWQWSLLGIWILVGLVGALLTNFVVRALLRPFVRTHPDSQSLVRALRRAASVFVFPLVVNFGVEPMELHGAAAKHVGQALTAVQIVGYVLLLIAGWDVVSAQIAERSAGQSNRADRLLVPVIRKLIRALIIGTGLLIAVATLTDVNLTALVASLGIGGLVVALAAKDSIENVFGSITILFDTPFAIGDWVKIDKVEGVIEEINLRSTRIRTFEDTLITQPNATLIRASVENFGARRVRRQRLYLKLKNSTSPAKIAALQHKIEDYLAGVEAVQQGRTIVRVDGIDDWGVSLYILTYFEVDSFAQEIDLRHGLLTSALGFAHELKVELVSRG